MMLIGAVPASALATPEPTASEAPVSEAPVVETPETDEATIDEAALGSFTSPATVEIRGAVRSDEVVEAVITADAVPQPTSYSYRWYVDDEEIPEATAPTLVVDPWYVDSRLTVVAVPELEGYEAETGRGTSPASDPIAPAQHTGSLTVALPQTIQASQVVTAVLGGDVSPEPTYTEYTWLVDGEPLADAWEQTLDLAQFGVSAGSTLAVTASSAAYGYTPVEATSAPVTVLPGPTVDADIVNLAEGLGIRLLGTYFLDTDELTVELHDDPLSDAEASSEQPLDADPLVLGTVTPDGDGRFAFEAPIGDPADVIRFVVRDARGTVLYFQRVHFMWLIDDEPEPEVAEVRDDDTGPRLADTGGPTGLAGVSAAALAMIVAGTALAWKGRRRRGIRSA